MPGRASAGEILAAGARAPLACMMIGSLLVGWGGLGFLTGTGGGGISHLSAASEASGGPSPGDGALDLGDIDRSRLPVESRGGCEGADCDPGGANELRTAPHQASIRAKAPVVRLRLLGGPPTNCPARAGCCVGATEEGARPRNPDSICDVVRRRAAGGALGSMGVNGCLIGSAAGGTSDVVGI